MEIIKQGATYKLDVYEISNGLNKTGETVTIEFVKGNIDGPEYRQNGMIVEDVLDMLMTHLILLNTGDLANQYTSAAIEKLFEAKCAILARKQDRVNRNVFGTYNK